MVKGVTEETKKHLLNELEDIEKQLNDLTKPEKTPVEPFIFSSLHLFTGMLFLILFFITVNSNLLVQQVIAAGSLLIATIPLLRVLADILNQKRITSFLGLLFLIIILILGISIYLLWTSFLVEVIIPLTIILILVFLLELLFFVFHSYLAFMRRLGSYEIKLTSLIAVFGLLILLANLLYSNIILLFLFVIVVGVFAKANLDFLNILRK